MIVLRNLYFLRLHDQGNIPSSLENAIWYLQLDINYIIFFCDNEIESFFFSSVYLFYHKLYCITRLNIRLQKNKWRGQDIVKLITCPLIKLQFYLG